MVSNQYSIPETPWDLIAQQRLLINKFWNRDFSLDPPLIGIGWEWQHPIPNAREPKRMVEDPEFDVLCQLESVRHEIECLECSREIGFPVSNTPAFDMIHFGTGALATAFGAETILREGSLPAFEPAFHTTDEARKMKKPNLFKDGVLPQILERIQLYNEITQGKVILTPCDAAGPWSIATSIWHYEDMLEAIYTDPDAVHHVMNIVTESLIDWWTIQEAYIGRWGRVNTSFSSPFLSRGCFIGDDCMVSVSPAIWEEFFLPYNNRLSRERGGMIHYHCCMKYENHLESVIKTDGFIGFDASLPYNDLDKIEAALVKAKGIWMFPLGPGQMDIINRLRGKVGMRFGVGGTDREDTIKNVKAFVEELSAGARI